MSDKSPVCDTYNKVKWESDAQRKITNNSKKVYAYKISHYIFNLLNIRAKNSSASSFSLFPFSCFPFLSRRSCAEPDSFSLSPSEIYRFSSSLFRLPISVLLFSFSLFPFSLTPAQSLAGTSGLFNIPTAEVSQDGQVLVGSSVVNKKYLKYSGYEYDGLFIYIDIIYLPNLEMSIRGTRKLDYHGGSHTIDRMGSIKYKLPLHADYLPDIAVGLQNPLSTIESANHFNSTYIVMTKNIQLDSFVNEIVITAGRGFDWIEAADHQYIGFWGGISVSLFKIIQLIAEYDAEYFNGAARISLFNHINIMAGYQNFDVFAGNISFYFKL